MQDSDTTTEAADLAESRSVARLWVTSVCSCGFRVNRDVVDVRSPWLAERLHAWQKWWRMRMQLTRLWVWGESSHAVLSFGPFAEGRKKTSSEYKQLILNYLYSIVPRGTFSFADTVGSGKCLKKHD